MHRNQSVSAYSFAMVPRADIPRSRFTVQTSHKTTFDAGSLFLFTLMKFCPVILFR